MRQRLVVADPDTHLPGVLRLGGQKTGLQIRVPGSQQRQLPSLRYNSRQRAKQKIQPLLAGQPAHNGEQQRPIVRLQPQRRLQLLLVLRFLRQ